MKKRTLALSSAVLLCLGLGVAVRMGLAQDASAPRAPDAVKARLSAQQKTAAQTAATYRAMDNATLLSRLAEQSAARREPFNSLAYRELQGRHDVSSASLVSLVRQTNSSGALLPLLLLRKLDQPSYLALPATLRATVLTDALRGSVMFNTWGVPGVYSEDASKAMIESGGSALPALRRMLSDTRPAPVFGGQEYMIYKHYQFRLCDYALFFIEKIRGGADFVMPASAGERDVLIGEILKRP